MDDSTDPVANQSKPSTSSSKMAKVPTKSQPVKMDFVPGFPLEVRDFSNKWFPAKVVEVDWEGRDVLVHFHNWSSRFDEWICMDSARLQPINHQSEKNSNAKSNRGKVFEVGEKVLAVWHNNKKYPAQITKVLDNANYEVLFYDGFQMEIKAKQISRMSKEQAEKLEIPIAPPREEGVDTDDIGSKEERRKKNKKIEVSELFRSFKKQKSQPFLKEDEPNVESETQPQPAQVKKKERVINRSKASGESIKLNDTKLPVGWEKRAKMKTAGTKAGKWDVVIIGPGGRTFRSKQDIKQYIFLHQMNHELELFDFRLGEDFYRDRGVEPPRRAKTARPPSIVKKEEVELATATAAAAGISSKDRSEATRNDSVSATHFEESLPLFVQEKGEDGLRCPLENCRKLFRRDDLLVMHIKHYHPALLKKLGCKTLRVEDLAAARTAFETEDVKPTSLLQSTTLPSTPVSSPPRARTSFSADRKPVEKYADLSDVYTGDVQISAKSGRRKTDKRPTEGDEVDMNDMSDQELEGLMDTPGVVHTSLLDDIPGQKELVHCFCGSPEEDGLMIQCELCLCWQHGICLAIDAEENVPDPYVCHFCRYPYRERMSQRYTHDQTWLKKGNLPALKFTSGTSSLPADRKLRVAHALTAAATDLKQLLHSLKVKIDIAKNKDHPKLYLWAQPWTKKHESEHPDVPVNESVVEHKPVCNVPMAEKPINAPDCRLNLISHISDVQTEVESRLESLEALFEECEAEEGLMDSTHVARTLQTLLKDVVTLKRMASFTWAS